MNMDELSYLGCANRYDDSGIRDKGVKRKPYQRAVDYPYDKKITYGQPAAYDRGTGTASSFNGTIIPKNTEHFSLTTLDLDEVLGYPMLINRGLKSKSDVVTPKAIGWSSNPPKDWYNESSIEAEPIEGNPFEYLDNETDEDIERKLDRIWGRNNNNNFVNTNVQDPIKVIPDESIWKQIAIILSLKC